MDPATIRRIMPAFPVYSPPTKARAALLVKQANKEGLDLPPAMALDLARCYPGQTAAMSYQHFRTARLAGAAIETMPTWFELGERALHGGIAPLQADATALPQPFLRTAYCFDTQETEPALAMAAAFSRVPQTVIHLSGIAGTGKTGLAHWLAAEGGQMLHPVNYADLAEGDYRRNIAQLLETAAREGVRILIEDIAPLHKKPSPHNDPLFGALAQHPYGAILTQDSDDRFARPPAGIILNLRLQTLPEAQLQQVAAALFGEVISVPAELTLAELVQVKRQHDTLVKVGQKADAQQLIDGKGLQPGVGFHRPAVPNHLTAPAAPSPNP